MTSLTQFSAATGTCFVSELVDLIDEMASESAPKMLRDHARSLIGPRTRGSTTEKSLSFVPADTVASAVKGANPPAKLFQFKCDLGTKIKAFPFGTVHAMLGIPVFVHDGDHGQELRAEVTEYELERLKQWSHEIDKLDMSPDLISVIVGPYECRDGSDWNGRDVVYSWHPGPVLGTLSCGIQRMTAVKVVVQTPQQGKN